MPWFQCWFFECSRIGRPKGSDLDYAPSAGAYALACAAKVCLSWLAVLHAVWLNMRSVDPAVPALQRDLLWRAPSSDLGMGKMRNQVLWNAALWNATLVDEFADVNGN